MSSGRSVAGSFAFACGLCGRRLVGAPDLAGRTVTCPHCGGGIEVPDPPANPSPPPSRPPSPPVGVTIPVVADAATDLTDRPRRARRVSRGPAAAPALSGLPAVGMLVGKALMVLAGVGLALGLLAIAAALSAGEEGREPAVGVTVATLVYATLAGSGSCLVTGLGLALLADVAGSLRGLGLA